MPHCHCTKLPASVKHIAMFVALNWRYLAIYVFASGWTGKNGHWWTRNLDGFSTKVWPDKKLTITCLFDVLFFVRRNSSDCDVHANGSFRWRKYGKIWASQCTFVHLSVVSNTLGYDLFMFLCRFSNGGNNRKYLMLSCSFVLFLRFILWDAMRAYCGRNTHPRLMWKCAISFLRICAHKCRNECFIASFKFCWRRGQALKKKWPTGYIK